LINDVDTVQVIVNHVDQFAGRVTSLGACYINMINFYNSPQILVDEWYPLVETSAMSERATGAVRLCVTYFNVMDPELQFEAAEGLKQPNCLEITVLNAVGITTSPVEAFVVIEVDKHRIESKLSKRSLNPSWEETISIPVRDGSTSIDITVKGSALLR
jgi:hypothetical protein